MTHPLHSDNIDALNLNSQFPCFPPQGIQGEKWVETQNSPKAWCQVSHSSGQKHYRRVGTEDLETRFFTFKVSIPIHWDCDS